MAHRTIRGAALLAACLAVAGCVGGPPIPKTVNMSPGPVQCNVVAQDAWAVRLAPGGKVLWRTRVRGFPDPAVAPTDDPRAKPSPVVAGGETATADGDAVTGLRLGDGRVLWRWTSPGRNWVTGLWQRDGLIIVLAGSGQAAQLTGLRASTGAAVWKRPVPGTAPSGQSGSEQAQTADGGLAVAGTGGSGGRYLEVISLADGTIRWRRSPGPRGPGTVAASEGTVAMLGGTLLTGYGDRTGSVRWTRPGPGSTSTLSVLGLNGQVTEWQDIAPSRPAIVRTVDAGTGHLRWQLRSRRMVPGRAPVPAGRDVITFQAPGAWRTGTGQSPVPGLKLVSTDAATGAVRWTRAVSSGSSGAEAPAIQAGADIVVGDGEDMPATQTQRARLEPPTVLQAYRADTGQPSWRAALSADIEAPPVPAGGGLVVQAGEDTATCARPD